MTLRLYLGDRKSDESSLPVYLLLAEARMPFDRVEGAGPVLESNGQRISGLVAIADRIASLPGARGVWPTDDAAARATVTRVLGSFAAFRAAYPYALAPPLPDALPSPESTRDLASIDALLAPRSAPLTIVDFALAPLAVRIRAYNLAVSPRAGLWVESILALPAMERWVRAASAV